MRPGFPGGNVGRGHKLELLPSLCGGFGDLSMLKASSVGRHDAVIIAHLDDPNSCGNDG